MKALAVVLLAFVLTSCSSVTLSPVSVSSVAGRSVEAEQLIETWRKAVALSNDFLLSEHNTTLPRGTLLLSEEGMTFAVNGESTPFEVRCNSSGDLLLPFKMVAQERSCGFVVGAVPPKESRAIDNSFFKDLSGKAMPEYRVASLMLHELSHVHHALGTVSPWKSIAYYAEAIFLFRYRNHSMERLPYRTSSEFHAYLQTRFSSE
jgi:hypothetical protein